MRQKQFEEQLESAKEILQKLMDPEITLKESINLYEEGLFTLKEAQRMIEDAKIKIEVIERGFKEPVE